MGLGRLHFGNSLILFASLSKSLRPSSLSFILGSKPAHSQKLSAVFGPTDPREWGPRGERVRTLGGPREGGFGAVTAERVCSALAAVMASG